MYRLPINVGVPILRTIIIEWNISLLRVYPVPRLTDVFQCMLGEAGDKAIQRIPYKQSIAFFDEQRRDGRTLRILYNEWMSSVPPDQSRSTALSLALKLFTTEVESHSQIPASLRLRRRHRAVQWTHYIDDLYHTPFPLCSYWGYGQVFILQN